jgi:hypothetical protein
VNPFDPGTAEHEAWQRQAAAEGAALLHELRAAITGYVILPSPEAADAVTLYIAATHAQTAWEHASRLVVKSPLKRCGKTRLQEVCRETVHNPLPTTNISAAALARSISEEDPPTLILDEADAVFGKRKGELREGAEDLRGIINAGHSRGWPYRRWNANRNSSEECATFAMAIIGGIGDMPDTIEDRGIVLAMRRRAPGEQVRQWRSRRAVPALRELRGRLHEWVGSVLPELESAEPELPAEDRAADVWEPLVAIADAAGGDWPDRARLACRMLTAGDDDPGSAGAEERILVDLAEVWSGHEDALFTSVILERLAKVEEAPWATWHRGDPLSPRSLAGLLRPYGVRSVNVRSAAGQAKGYRWADLVEPWRRYVDGWHDPGAPPSQPSQPSQSDESAAQPGDGRRDGSENAKRPGSRPGADQPEQPSRDGGTAGTEEGAERATDYCRTCGMSANPDGSERHTSSCRSDA